MAIFKCKMCGGDLNVQEGMTVCECEYCGTKQTIPTVDDDGLKTLFNRANTLRMRSEFDKAADIYEKILQKNEQEAEAYWGLILCRYGIEYVEDPVTYKRIPTCHRASYDAVTADDDYKNALKYADIAQRSIFEAEAAAIDEIQKGIITLAQKEDPYDVFICYKETDDSGKRTQDSVIANDIYHQLTQEGFKVFYAAITLEDKLGTEYEPYIFSALNSAKVMLALGTKPEYFTAVWVKNEWSRYLKLMKKDRSRLLIPCYRDMDAYELPEEFSHLQAQDMGKIGFIADLVRGIKKIVIKDEPSAKEENITATKEQSGNINALLKRGKIALEDYEWEKADGFYEEVLNISPECAEAYLGKLLAKEKKQSFKHVISSIKTDILNSKKIEKQRLSACSENHSHIKEMMKKNVVSGYLTEEQIREMYTFDRSYYSTLASLKAAKVRINDIFNKDRLMARFRKYATGELKEQAEIEIQSIYQLINERIEKAEKDEAGTVARITDAYRQFIRETDQKVQNHEAKGYPREDQEQERIMKATCERLIQELEEKENKLKSLGWFKKDVKKTLEQEISMLQPQIDIAYRKFVSKTIKNLVREGKDRFVFGHYKSCDLVWRILKAESNRVLVLSEKGLGAICFAAHDPNFRMNYLWENSPIRTFLNSTFFNSFTAAEREMIATVKNNNSDRISPLPAGSSASSGSDTQDRVFLLSFKEVNQYLPTDSDRRCLTLETGKLCDWWLRSTGSGPFPPPINVRCWVASVYKDGSIHTGDGPGVSTTYFRPAMWIELDKDVR